MDSDHAFFGGILSCLRWDLVYPSTEFEVYSFTRSKFTEGVLKF